MRRTCSRELVLCRGTIPAFDLAESLNKHHSDQYRTGHNSHEQHRDQDDDDQHPSQHNY